MSLDRVGQFIRSSRKQLKWTQEQLAGKAKIDPAYLRRLEAGKQLGSAYSLIEIAKALNIKPGILIDLLANIEPDDEWQKINDAELRTWLNPTNLNRLSRTSRRTLIAIVKTELEEHRPLQNGQLVAFVHSLILPGETDGNNNFPKGAIKQLETFPAEVAQTLDTVIAQDSSFFVNNPNVTEFKRDYVRDEFWPDLEELEPEQLKVLVIKHPEYNLYVRVALILTNEDTKALIVRVSYTKEFGEELAQQEGKTQEVVDSLLDSYLKTKPELFGAALS